MANPFKVGDMVKCVNDNEATYRVTNGETYKVLSLEVGFHGEPMLRIVDNVGTRSSMYAWRFVKTSARNLPAWF